LNDGALFLLGNGFPVSYFRMTISNLILMSACSPLASFPPRVQMFVHDGTDGVQHSERTSASCAHSGGEIPQRRSSMISFTASSNFFSYSRSPLGRHWLEEVILATGRFARSQTGLYWPFHPRPLFPATMLLLEIDPIAFLLVFPLLFRHKLPFL